MTGAFPWAHATHPDWRMSVALCLAQIEQGCRTGAGTGATLGFLYLTDHYAADAAQILATLRERTGVASWTGAIGVGVSAGAAEYIDEPAMALMLADFAPDDFQIFSGKRPPPSLHARTPDGRRAAWTAVVHADAAEPDVGELIGDMAGKIHGGTVFGGLASGRQAQTQIADEVLSGGISGVVLSENIVVTARLTQGCQPIGPIHRVTAATGRLLNRLDDAPALDVLLQDMGAPARPAGAFAADGTVPDAVARQQQAAAVQMLQGTFVGMGEAGAFARGDYQVRPLIGIDPHEGALAVGADLDDADHVVFCRRDRQAAHLDLVRACTELRESVEHEHGGTAGIRGALYFSCLGRTGALFGGPSAEMQLVRHYLGDVPLIGLFANGEIFHDRLYGYTGVLIAFM